MDLSQLVTEHLRTDEAFILYRGRQSSLTATPSVLLLAPASTRPARETLKKIEHEYSLRDELDSAWAVRPVAVSEHRGHKTLVLEDPGGETLDRFLPGPTEMTRFLRFAVGIATALGGLHEKGLIHKDVKPGNLLVNPATGQARLMRFGIASRLPRELQASEPPEFIAGTLPYMWILMESYDELLCDWFRCLYYRAPFPQAGSDARPFRGPYAGSKPCPNV